MSANDLLTELFNVVIKHLQDIMQYDIFVAICAVVIISLTVQAAHWIGLVLNMSVEEKNARSALTLIEILVVNGMNPYTGATITAPWPPMKSQNTTRN